MKDTLDRCCDFETRSAALYRSFAAGVSDQPDLCALWTAMAGDEADHARLLHDTRHRLPTSEGWVTHLSGRWDKVVREVETKLSEAERLSRTASVDQQLAAALELEMTEIEPLCQMLVAVAAPPATTNRGDPRASPGRCRRALQRPPARSAAGNAPARPGPFCSV
jgi:hypothetical protein